MVSTKFSRLDGVLKEISKNTPADMRENFDVFIVGSARASKRILFNPRLSDIDLLFVYNTQTFGDYVTYLKETIGLVRKVEASHNELLEVFFASSSVVQLYFTCLSTIGGAKSLAVEDLLLGSGACGMEKSAASPAIAVRKNLYISRAINFCNEYGRLLPVADTAQSRKIAKVLHRGLKLIACSHFPLEQLDEVEEKLFSSTTFEDIQKLLKLSSGIDFQVDEIIQNSFLGKDVIDWPEWMIAQDKVARQLLALAKDERLAVSEFRLYETLGSIVHDMLIARLKDIIIESSDRKRNLQIQEFADTSASLVSRLALVGVKSLYNLDSNNTPKKVRYSYQTLVRHLQEGSKNIDVLAASVVLLEYSLAEGVRYANRLNKP